MILNWLNGEEAAEIGTSLADRFAPPATGPSLRPSDDTVAPTKQVDRIEELLRMADRDVRALRLNVFKKAKFANHFKWRLLENGVEKSMADDLTRQVLVHLAKAAPLSAPREDALPKAGIGRPASTPKHLLATGNKYMTVGKFAEAATAYRKLIAKHPRHAAALNNLGAALSKLGSFVEAEKYFRRAISADPNLADAHSNIGNTLLLSGRYESAESFLRRGLKLNPRLVEARINLGVVLTFLSRLREAKAQFDKALKHEPSNAEALVGLALIAKTEGAFDHAGVLLAQALQSHPLMPKALASQASMHKMTAADRPWLAKAERSLASGITRVDESELRFAMGKYYDDLADFNLAFQNYQHANELLKPLAEPYDREVYKRFVDAMIAVYTMKAARGVDTGSSTSERPVFIVGMPRSGTSLVEQILSSHPRVYGAGELPFWSSMAHEYGTSFTEHAIDEPTRKKLAEAYLRVIETEPGAAVRVIDKSPVNADYLGIIHAVFPQARIIYMQRDPVDTCLSCYFQKFVLSLNFTLDLSDLADYYRQHARLMAHWRAVLPPGTILDVPYEELVADQEGWSRKIINFLGLEWDAQVLDFNDTKRAVVTASHWQVRQKLYKHSVQRWRNYQKLIGPLMELKRLAR